MLTITSGSELGEFVDQDGQSLGRSVTRKGSQIGTILFAANGEQPQGAQGTVTVEALSRDIRKTITITVIRTAPLVDHFEVRPEPEEIAFTESSKIFVQAKDANDQDIEFDENELLTFTLLGESAYGTYTLPTGDTVKMYPVEVRDVRYGDARMGAITFAAVSLQSDPLRFGQKPIVVLEKTLRIVMIGLQEVRPFVPNDIHVPRSGSLSLRTEFRVQLTRGGAQVAGHSFRLTSDYLDGSGGHDHVALRRDRNPLSTRFLNCYYRRWTVEISIHHTC
ncbi:MAG: hypothetical protein FJ217_06315 [Ignavibacteria bacterium]|nr:hypothetical protein [Ignavibacteria bacterium]